MNIGDVPELAAEWLRTRPQFCSTCGTYLPDGLPCVGCEADGWYAEAATWYAARCGECGGSLIANVCTDCGTRHGEATDG